MSEMNYNKRKVFVPWYDEVNIKKFGKYPKKYGKNFKKKKLKTKKLPKEFKLKLAKMSAQLNSNRPASEMWFEQKFGGEPISMSLAFLKNEPFGYYIPDFRDNKHRIIVEIDGSIHDRPDIAKKDKKKDKFYKNMGYRVVRIVAYNDQSYAQGIAQITLFIATKFDFYPKKKQPVKGFTSKVIVRKKD